MENKISFDPNLPKRYQGILTKAILAWGGSLWKIKFIGTKADPVVTKEFSPSQFSREGGSLWKKKFLSTRADPGVTKELAQRQTPS